MIRGILEDLRYAFRQLGKSPGFTTVAVVTLALGIGACAAIFSVVNSVLLRPLAFPEPDRVVAVTETFLPRFPEFSTAPGKYFVWQKQSKTIARFAAIRGASYNLTGKGEPVRLEAARLTASVLETYQVTPLLGRNFTAEEDTPGKNDVVILSHGLWQRQFGGRPDVLSQTIQLDGRSHTVVGVMPRQSPLPQKAEIFAPMAFADNDRTNFGGHFVRTFGRLAPGVTVEQASSEMNLIADRIGQQYPEAKGWALKLAPMLEQAVGEVRPILLSLLGAVGLLLLIACANVANLLLARATGRSREIAVRLALGASSGRIVRQLLVESLVLAVLGGLLGVLVAQGGLQAMLAMAPESLPRAKDIAVDGRALGFTFALALVTGVAFGLVPAFQASRVQLQETLKESSRSTSEGGRKQRLRGALVVGEVAVALTLLAGAGLLMRSFALLASVSPGFQAPGALVASVNLPGQKYQGGERKTAFLDQVLARLAALPGVVVVGAAQHVPFAGGQEMRGVEIEGRKTVDVQSMPVTNHYTVTAGYFRAMGIPLLRGRAFAESDRASTTRVAIINENMARKLFPGEDPLGKRITISNGPDRWRQIVGIAGDVKPDKLDGVVPLQTYEPYAQQPGTNINLVLRSAAEDGGASGGLPAAVRAAVHGVDPEQPVAKIRPMTDVVAESIGRQRFAMFLFAVFSGVALFLAAIGIYGVMAYSVSQRTAEIGIRMSLGAQTGDVLRLVMGQGGRLIALGIGTGLLLALGLTRLLDSMLFGVPTYDPPTFVAIAMVLATVAAAACLVPAGRATRVDPLTALRDK
jgi:putative ABC transport system permease protein